MNHIFESLLSPPGINVLLLLLGLIFVPLLRGLGFFLIFIGTITFYLLSTNFIASILLHSLDQYPHLNLDNLTDNGVQAIVILGGGAKYAPEQGGAVISDVSFMRENYAAKLYQKTKLPVYISGGDPQVKSFYEAKLMANDLDETFKVPTYWIETQSKNTYENAMYLKEILNKKNIRKFYLVTSSWHMPRAMWSFQKLEMDPIAAPTDFELDLKNPEEWQNWLPNNLSLFLSNKAIHEYVGLLWYKYHYREPTSSLVVSEPRY